MLVTRLLYASVKDVHLINIFGNSTVFFKSPSRFGFFKTV